MTTTERPPVGDRDAADESGSRRAARSAERRSAVERTYERRRRRERSMLDPRLTAVGRPIRASLGKVPVVLAAIVLLGGGIAGVLTINTMSDELGLQVSRTNTAIVDLQLQVEALQQAVADADSTPRIAQEARKLGMGPADDPAIITIDGKGRSTLIGTPTPQAAAVPAAPPATATSTAPSSAAAPTPGAGAATAPATAAQTKPTQTKPTQTKPTQTKPAQTKPAQTKPTKPSTAGTTGGNR
jgi:hypothetical protein